MGGPEGLSCVPRLCWAPWARLALALLPGAGVALRQLLPLKVTFQGPLPPSFCAHLPPSSQALAGLVAL